MLFIASFFIIIGGVCVLIAFHPYFSQITQELKKREGMGENEMIMKNDSAPEVTKVPENQMQNKMQNQIQNKMQNQMQADESKQTPELTQATLINRQGNPEFISSPVQTSQTSQTSSLVDTAIQKITQQSASAMGASKEIEDEEVIDLTINGFLYQDYLHSVQEIDFNEIDIASILKCTKHLKRDGKASLNIKKDKFELKTEHSLHRYKARDLSEFLFYPQGVVFVPLHKRAPNYIFLAKNVTEVKNYVREHSKVH